MLMYELDDAREALEKLVNEMKDDPEFSEEQFRIDLGHIYAHLNSAWHIRNGEKIMMKEILKLNFQLILNPFENSMDKRNKSKSLTRE